MKKTTNVCFTVIVVLLAILTGCFNINDPLTMEPDVWQISLDREEFSVFHSRNDAAVRHELTLTVTNTGTQAMGEMMIGLLTDKIEHELEFEISRTSIPSLNSGESTEFTVTFPFRDRAIMYEGTILVGNTTAAARMPLRYGVYDLENDPLFTMGTELLQIGTSESSAINTTDPEFSGEWIFDRGFYENGVYHISDEPGEVLIGFLISEDPFHIKGKRIMVYPAIQTLDYFYIAPGSGDLIRPGNGSAFPINLTQIMNTAGSDNLIFTLISGGGVVSSINPNNGELTFQGSDGFYGTITATVEIIRTVPEGSLTVFRNTISFVGRIGIPPPPNLFRAETVNGPADLQTLRIDLIFDMQINAGALDPRDGFTITKAPSTPVPIQQAVIADNILQITLAAANPVVLGDVLTLSYARSSGGIQNAGGAALENITAFPIINQLEEQVPGPEMVSAEIDGTNRNDAYNLVVTYDKPLVLTSAAGFSIRNLTGGPITFTAYSTAGNILTLTMSRLPMWTELQANNLILDYDGAVGTVSGLDTIPGLSGSAPIMLENFEAGEYAPPVVQSVTLDGNAQTSLVIQWDKNLAAGMTTAGYTMGGATPAITFTASSQTGATQTLTMSRIPTTGELPNLTLNYNAAAGVIADTSGNRADSFTGRAVTITNQGLFIDPPVLQTAIINAANPTALVLTFDKAVAITNSEGFSISGSQTATSFTTGVSGSGTATITLTLNRKPAFGETLQLSYTGNGTAVDQTNANVRVAAITNRAVTLNGFTAAADSRPILQTIVVDANRDSTGASFDQAKTVYLTFDKAVLVTNENGFAIAGSDTAYLITGVTGSGTTVLVLQLNNPASESEITGVTLSYNMDLGNVRDTDNNLLLSFSRPITFLNYTGLGPFIDTERPWLVSATVSDATRSIVQVVFNKRVTVDRTRFIVKVNNTPITNMSGISGNTGPVMDFGARVRTITSAAPVGEGTHSTTWNLTMSVPAQFGEILRLASGTPSGSFNPATDFANVVTPVAGAATDVAGNELLAIPQFIVRSLVERTRGAFETGPGLYRNGTLVAESNTWGDQTFQNAIARLSTSGNYPAQGEIITIVLAQNQIRTASSSFSNDHFASNDANRANAFYGKPTRSGNTLLKKAV